jgi:hypothetical protein
VKECNCKRFQLYLENDRSLDAIEMIVKKHFSQASTPSKKGKKRLVSGANGRSVTDLDEFALTAIKKKKTTENKTAKKNNSKKVTNTQKQNIPSSTNVCSTTGINTTNITPVGNYNLPLPPISYMLSSNTSPMISTFQSNAGTYGSLHNLAPVSSSQCQLCFNFIKPVEITSNCSQCRRMLCWECSSKIDQNYQLCHSCRAYYTSQQQTYYHQNQNY